MALKEQGILATFAYVCQYDDVITSCLEAPNTSWNFYNMFVVNKVYNSEIFIAHASTLHLQPSQNEKCIVKLWVCELWKNRFKKLFSM